MSCYSCGATNPDGSRFCNECGAKLEPIPVREERKMITALFCDLVGSTALGERLDPEDISRLLHDYQAICRSRIESHGGVVEKFIGDAVVGLFGVPVAHEDDPERAVLAALRVVGDISASELSIEVRVGVNTGETLVRLDVDPNSGEGFATGDALNTAARLEAAAPTMGVAVGAATHRATEDTIIYEELAPISAKGKSQPVPAWLALHPNAHLRTKERDRTPFVGRDLELSMLTQLFERSRSRPATQFVTIVAEPGLGKSRLVRELGRRVDQLSDLVTWREGGCLPYGDGISFRALGEIVRAQAGILETDDQETISSKLDRTLVEPDPQTRAWIKDRLAPLVGLETTTEPPQREEAFSAWRRFLEQLAGAGPTVLVIEDLHWADEAFVSFLEHLAERTAGLPLLVVVTARPELEERHPSWPPGRHSTVLSLSRLDDVELETLVSQTLPQAEPQLIDIVLERAGGSPLYAEQLAAMVRERALPIAGGVLDETMIPPSVQALIAARIDALPPESKRVLMEASVVGKTFWAGAVASLGEHQDLDAVLGELVRREFCRLVHPSTMEGDREFGFWHALVRDVAYAALTRGERARMHAATARWITSRAADALGEDAEIVVHHLDAALQLAPAAPELETDGLTDLLADALAAAGQAALRTEVPRAIPYLERALEALPPDDARLPVLRSALARANDGAGNFAVAATLLEEVEEEYWVDGNLDAAVDAAITLLGILWQMGQTTRSDALIVKIKERVGPNPSSARAEVLSVEAIALSVSKDYPLAIEHAEESIAIAEGLGIEPSPRALLAHGTSRLASGDLEGEAEVREAAARFLQGGEASGAALALFNLAAVMDERGPTYALPVNVEAIELAERLGTDAYVWLGRASRLRTLARLGRFDEVLDEANQVLDWVAEHDDAFSRLLVLTGLATVEIERGERLVDPAELADLCRRMANEETLIVAARLALARAEGDLARDLVLEGSPNVRLGDAYGFARLCVEAGLSELATDLLSREVARHPREEGSTLGATAILAEAKGKHAAARTDYAEATETFRMLQMAPDLAHALQGLGRCLLALGENDHGAESLRQARALWEQMKAKPRIAETDILLAMIQE